MKKMVFIRNTSRILILILAIFLLTGCQKYSEQELENLANCLGEKGAHYYGAFWCSSCALQADLFGSAKDIIKVNGVYVECDPRCVADNTGRLPKECKIGGQPQLCLEKNIQYLPTWYFIDGSKLIGVVRPEVLAEKVGCSFKDD